LKAKKVLCVCGSYGGGGGGVGGGGPIGIKPDPAVPPMTKGLSLSLSFVNEEGGGLEIPMAERLPKALLLFVFVVFMVKL
jgi:hypothetical protein